MPRIPSAVSVLCVAEEEKEQISEQVIDAMLENKSESDSVLTVPVVQTDSKPTDTESSVNPAQESDPVAGGAVEKSDAEAKDVKPEVSAVESSSELVEELKASGNFLTHAAVNSVHAFNQSIRIFSRGLITELHQSHCEENK